jgi:hypothetical protein
MGETTLDQTVQAWLDFSTRLLNAYNLTKKRKEKAHRDITEFISMYEGEEVKDWDNAATSHGLVCEHFDDYFHEHDYMDKYGGHKVNSYFNLLRSCVRAGLDVAVGRVGGVIGFTVGDLKKIYGGKIPERVMKATGINYSWKDDEGVWL